MKINKIKRLTAVILAVLLGTLTLTNTTIFAEEKNSSIVDSTTQKTQKLADDVAGKTKEKSWPDEIEITAPNAIVMEVNSGTILYEKNSHEKHYPASITKIMTTYLAVENSSLDEVVKYSADAVFKNEGNSSHIARDEGEEMSLEQSLYAVMLESANECAYAVAEHVGEKKGGDYKTFIRMMNSKAKELGCKDTHFNNSNGLPDEQHYTTAYDMALISCAAYKNADFRKIATTKKYTISPTNKHPEETFLQNHHAMMYPRKTRKYLYDGCVGGKTGYTVAANNTLVTYANRGNMTLCCVILNAQRPDHYTNTAQLFDYCFDKFENVNIYQNLKDKTIAGKKANMSTQKYVTVPKDVKLSNCQRELIKESKNGKNKRMYLQFSYGNHIVGKTEITFDKSNKNEGLKAINLKGNRKKVIGISVLVALMLGVIVAARIRKIKNNKR
ncbi:D-alanyl-D-alanine carboxypeptidase [Lachnospiraceae bacterium C7]|nr:D-alanyl-D-alanine carboxypeptidase [Lachnospiraceae bacterium C7]